MGLIDTVDADPAAAAIAWVDTHLKPKSASSLRLAVRAARDGFLSRVNTRLDEVEALYLNDLMSTRDAVEGLTAFLAKRSAKWENK